MTYFYVKWNGITFHQQFCNTISYLSHNITIQNLTNKQQILSHPNSSFFFFLDPNLNSHIIQQNSYSISIWNLFEALIFFEISMSSSWFCPILPWHLKYIIQKTILPKKFQKYSIFYLEKLSSTSSNPWIFSSFSNKHLKLSIVISSHLLIQSIN